MAADVGGTKTLLATLSPEGKIVEQVKFPTPQSYSEFLEVFKQHLSQFRQQDYQAAAIAIPAVIDRTTGVGLTYGNLSWLNTPVKQDLGKIIGCPVLLENDGKLGGLAEAILVKNEFKNVLYLAIGTGIGIAYTANGIIDTSIPDGGGDTLLLEHDGKTQPWEDFTSGKAIVERFGKKASELTDQDQAAWQTIAHNISLGILYLLQTLQPDVIVIGGGVGAHFEHFGKLLQKELEEQLGHPAPPLRQAQHAEEAVIYGCYNLIQQSQHGKTA